MASSSPPLRRTACRRSLDMVLSLIYYGVYVFLGNKLVTKEVVKDMIAGINGKGINKTLGQFNENLDYNDLVWLLMMRNN